MPYDSAEAVSTEPKSEDAKDYLNSYLEAIERYDRGSEEWRLRCEKIVRIYLDQHRTQASPRRFALLWSNIETLKPAVYARIPQAVVSRRYKDQDPAGRKASEVLERCINTSFDLGGVDETLRAVRDDRLLTGRGTAWVRYEAEFGEDEQVTAERVVHDFVHWTDFGHDLARTWRDVKLVWRRVYMTKAQVAKRWDDKQAAKLNYEVRSQPVMVSGDPKQATEPQACIYEIWDKRRTKACWIAKEEKLLLEEGPPPLDLRNFFPCPEPSYGTRATGSLIPTPDYRYYQDQAEEIDDLTQRIASLSEWLVLKAFIPAGPSSEGGTAVLSMLQAITDRCMAKGVFVPVESWAGFSEKGGARLIDWLPIDLVAKTIQAAIECRQQLVADVYQITGISDILRGETDPNETLGAQQLKAQTGSRRVSTTQRDLARFARDLAEMTGEVVAEIFQPSTIEEMTGLDLQTQAPMPQGMPGQPLAPEQQQQFQQAQQEAQLNQQVLQILRDEKTRSFRIEIETDSTIEPDEQAEKQRRTEFLEAVGGFVERVMPIVQMAPSLLPMVSEMLLFMVRGFRAGRQLEDSIERSMAMLTQEAQQPKPPDPKVQAEQAKAQAVQQKSQMDMQATQQKNALAMQSAQQKHQLEMEKMRAELHMMNAEMGMAYQKLGMERQQMEMKAEHEEKSLALKGEASQAQHEMTMAEMGGEEGETEPTPAQSNGGMTSDKALMGELVKALQALSAPKRVVRDNSGRVVGSEPVTLQ
jgi:hypothetical protein